MNNEGKIRNLQKRVVALEFRAESIDKMLFGVIKKYEDRLKEIKNR